MSATRSDALSQIPHPISLEDFAVELAAKFGPRGTSYGWLRKRAKRGDFTHIYIGGRYYLTPEMVTEFLAQHTQTPPPAPAAEDPLAATRARVARQRASRAPKQRGAHAA